uniref:Uncharacterized protein n=1 Tax=Arundo donax TaxID=35708 RepID=A0A0A8Y5W8_ARUDO
MPIHRQVVVWNDSERNIHPVPLMYGVKCTSCTRQWTGDMVRCQLRNASPHGIGATTGFILLIEPPPPLLPIAVSARSS